MAPTAPRIVTQTKIEVLKPSNALLQECEKPVYVTSSSVRNIQENRMLADVAFRQCAARVHCIIWWYKAAEDKSINYMCTGDKLRGTDRQD